MFKTKMQNLELLLLLEVSCLLHISAQHIPRGRIRIANIPTRSSTNNLNPIPLTDDVNFPNGFKPQSPPQITLNYPINNGEWLVPSTAAPPTTLPRSQVLLMPQSQPTQQLPVIPEFEHAVQPGPALETIVYGNWKPEHPIKPEEISSSEENERVTNRLEAMLMGLPVDSLDSVEGQQDWQSFERTPNARLDNVAVNSEKKFGRRRIPTRPIRPVQTIQQTPDVISVNATDPLLKEMAVQINDSFESTTVTTNDRFPIRHVRTTARTTENTWIPVVPENYETTTSRKQANATVIPITTTKPTMSTTQKLETSSTYLNWPTDFIEPTTNRPQYIDDNEPNIESKYYDDNVLNSAQMHSEFSIAESLVPQLPLNITHVGVPYEELNSAEEPTICVPLTVSEVTVSEEGEEKIDVERVYCFPLPQVEVKAVVNGSQIAVNTTKSSIDNISNTTQTSCASVLKNYNLLLTYCIWHISLQFISL